MKWYFIYNNQVANKVRTTIEITAIFLMELNRQSLFILSCITLFGFSTIGLIIILLFQDVSITKLFTGSMEWYKQVTYGLLYGVGTAFIGMSIMRFTFFENVVDFFKNLFEAKDVRYIDLFFVAFSAGIGEEILFRGAIQPFLGIWITSILFAIIHGYLNPRLLDWFIVGLLTILLSLGLGYLFEYCGLISAIIAHFIYDLILIYFYKKME